MFLYGYVLKYFSSFAFALLANDGAHFFLPIFTAAKDEKHFINKVSLFFPLQSTISQKLMYERNDGRSKDWLQKPNMVKDLAIMVQN